MSAHYNAPTAGECDCQAYSADECNRCHEGMTRQRCGLLPNYCGHFFHYAVFSERELTFTFAICYGPTFRLLSVVRLSSVTFVRPTQRVEIVGNVFRRLVPWPSVDIHENCTKIVPGEPLLGGG